MTSIKIHMDSLERWFFIVILAELILGGSGHLFAVGPLSLRIFFLALMVGLDFVLLLRGKVVANLSNLILFVMMVYFAGLMCYSILTNDVRDAADTFAGYIVIIVCPVFLYLFRENRDLIYTTRRVFYVCTAILSIVTILIWGYCLVFGVASYPLIQGLFNRFQYGALAFVGPVPRVFLKGSIFICCALFLCVMEFAQDHKFSRLVLSGLYTVAILMTFTTSFYAFTAILLLVELFHIIGKKRFVTFLSIILGLGLIGLVVAYQAGIIDVFIERFSGDYNFSYKGIQVRSILSHGLVHPIFGNGFGYNIFTDYGYVSKVAYSFEVMWGQLFLDTGLVGLILFLAHMGVTLYDLLKNYKISKNHIYYAFALGLIMFCLVSFTNPFMNNAIGLLFYAVCAGLSSVDERPASTEGRLALEG